MIPKLSELKIDRKPSLHITENNLKFLLMEELKDLLSEKEINSLSERIIRKGKNLSLSHRGIYVSNDKLLKKAEKIKLSNKSDTALFSEYLVLLRRKLRHRAIKQIKPGESEWFIIKELTQLATEFCNEFGLSTKEGYKEYISLGLSMMKNYSLNKFKGLHAPIVNRYDAKYELQMDPSPGRTEEIYKTYVRYINEKTGMLFEDYKNQPEKYVCFKRAKEEAEKININPKTFIIAQFEFLGFKSTVPDPSQLYGEKAIQRARKYCVENEIKAIDVKKSIDFSRIKAKA